MPESPRRKRSRPIIDSVRSSTLSLVNCNSYLPAQLVRRVKITAVDRDGSLRVLNDTVPSIDEWPSEVVPISGASGVIAQVLSDHFSALDERDRAITQPSKPSRSAARRRQTS